MTCNDSHADILNRLGALEETVDDELKECNELQQLRNDTFRNQISQLKFRNRNLGKQVLDLQNKMDELESHLLLHRPELFPPRSSYANGADPVRVKKYLEERADSIDATKVKISE